jgi:hypothetical protein
MSEAPSEVRECPDGVWVRLSEAQFDGLARVGAEPRSPSLGHLLSGLAEARSFSCTGLESRYRAELKSDRLSHALFRGLLVLSYFVVNDTGESIGVAALSRELAADRSTTHRYLRTLVAFGLLTQDSATRRYRLAGCSDPACRAAGRDFRLRAGDA